MQAGTTRNSAQPLRVALAGLGTVGAGVVRLLDANASLIEARAGRAIRVVAVSARDRDKDRGVDLSPFEWCDDMTAMAVRQDVDAVVELVGGADGPALTLARNTLASGKALVTANKAMIAHHGLALGESAEAAGVPLKFEAAVAGGIPIIKALREGAAANAIDRVQGILNGTCNYILSTMEDTGRDFGDVLAEAQAKGFAEADPTLDIEGIDAGHKLAILAAIAFGARLDLAHVSCEGIARVRAADIARARDLGFVIRLIGEADVEHPEDGSAARLLQRVRPCLVPKDHPLAHVDGPTNAVVAQGNYSGRLLFQGAGAGDGPTASAVVADLIDIARWMSRGGSAGADTGGETGGAFSVPVGALVAMEPAEPGERRGRTYIRFTVADRPGVLAEITAAMRDAEVSIESLIQTGPPEALLHAADQGGSANQTGEALVAMVTHEGAEHCVTEALRLLEGSASLTAPPLVMPILAA